MIVDPSLAVEDIADRIEWACVGHSAGYLAWADVIRQVRLTISEDEMVATYSKAGDGGPEGRWANIERFETMLEEWVEALSHRARACGPGDAYPFDITGEGLELRSSGSPAYLFQLFVSLGSMEAHHDGTTVPKLFEELSAAAAGRYLGDSKTAVVFGWPRRDLPLGFRNAVAALVNHLREGNGCRDREGLDNSKDDGLDVVAWREFPDRNASKLILFGQCAVGRRWKGKTHDLQPSKWCKRNLAGSIAVNPIPAFFIPMALSEKDANFAGTDQILLDRCRISALCSGTLHDRLDERLQEWIEASLKTGIALDAD